MKKLLRGPAVPLAAAVLIVLLSAAAEARPGGGSSFGGGRSSGGGGGSSDGGGAGQLIIFLVELTFTHPMIGIPLDIIVIAVAYSLYKKSSAEKKADWSTAAAATARAAPVPSRAVRRQLYYSLSQSDPEFSLVLFEDFLYSLYAAVHEARGAGRLQTLAPYLHGAALARLGSPGLSRVHSVVIGALRYKGFQARNAAGRVEVTLELETNYTEVSKSGGEQAYYVVERWTLSRAFSARSRKPEAARTIGCPNCGAPLDGLRGNTCSYCNQVVTDGRFDWMVDSIVEAEKTPRPPQLTGDTPEWGNNLPTVVDPEAQGRFQALTQKDPSFSWQSFSQRLGHIFAEMQVSWSTLEWSRARPFVSDQLFQMLSYWIETYRRSGMRNVTENARITRMEVAAALSDRYYDAITVRVFATSLDYTITNDGRVVSGSRSRERAYTEYWTLIRGARARTPASDRVCPNCGAPLAINMAGNCTVCKVKVTAGEFDWVLSRIEQDEAYG